MQAIYKSLCPNCNGDISADRLAKKLPCYECVPEEITSRKDAYQFLKAEGKLANFTETMKKPSGRSTKLVLLVVESPTKARTITRFFGKSSAKKVDGIPCYKADAEKYRLCLVATNGHLFDLVSNEGFHGVKAEDRFIPIYDTIKRCRHCKKQFVDDTTCPICGSQEIQDTAKTIAALRKIAAEAELVLAGTDPDAEGEKIAYDVRISLSPYTKQIQRAEFHEITKPAVLEAMEEPGDIKIPLINAQIVRRIEDRWIGFVLSQKLWDEFDDKTLSAGRVQTPVLGWIIDRYNEYQEKIDYVRLTLEKDITLRLKRKLPDPKQFLEQLTSVDVVSTETNEKVKHPFPPYSTQLLLRDVGVRLGLSSMRTMKIAQSLFEAGLITYHRTDSVRVSNKGISIAKKYVLDQYGTEYFKASKWGEVGAHECIRPTQPIDASTLKQRLQKGSMRLTRRLYRDHFRVYDLIFKRFIASQMIPAKIKLQKVVFALLDEEIVSEGVVEVLEEGFRKEYFVWWKTIPELSPGETLPIKEKRHWRGPKVPLYSESGIIGRMQKKKIGRPSTYAQIINILLQRHYVFTSKKKKKLIPSDTGKDVFRYLAENYSHLVSEQYTRRLEEKMDQVERGEISCQETLENLYNELREI